MRCGVILSACFGLVCELGFNCFGDHGFENTPRLRSPAVLIASWWHSLGPHWDLFQARYDTAHDRNERARTPTDSVLSVRHFPCFAVARDRETLREQEVSTVRCIRALPPPRIHKDEWNV